MAFGTGNKLVFAVLVILACGMFVSAMSFAEPKDMVEDAPTCKIVVKTVSFFTEKFWMELLISQTIITFKFVQKCVSQIPKSVSQ